MIQKENNLKKNNYSNTFVGTKNFMSPERIMGKNHSIVLMFGL